LRKTAIFTIVVLLTLNVYAIEPISRTDKLIQDAHEDTRAYCNEVFTAYGDNLTLTYQSERRSLLNQFNQIIWFDRVFTAIMIFCVVLLAGAINKLIYRINLRKYETLLDKYKNGKRE
jgi:hypothetical protein